MSRVEADHVKWRHPASFNPNARIIPDMPPHSLPSFGKFKVKDSAARQGRNPGTAETIRDCGVPQARLQSDQAGEGRARLRLTSGDRGMSG
jgi:hypothetical protein